MQQHMDGHPSQNTKPTSLKASDVPLGTLPASLECLLGQMNLELFASDHMYKGNDRHYLSCGASAMSMILAALQASNTNAPTCILDFGAGAGRVTRWLRAAFPDSEIYACEITDEAFAFLSKEFDARIFLSSVEIENLNAPTSYDLIWVGSVLTHLSEEKSLALVQKLSGWLKPGGLLIASLHGRRARKIQEANPGSYGIDDEAWQKILRECDEFGYGYADYPKQTGYGISLTTPVWAVSKLVQEAGRRLILFTEAGWDNHHDVVAVQRTELNEHGRYIW